MKIGLYQDKRNDEILYFEDTEGDFCIADSFEGKKKIPMSELPNYQQIDFFQAKKIEKDLRKRAGWLEDLLDSRFYTTGEINSAELLRQISKIQIGT